MGNHEYCLNCEEDDFHLGTACDPKKVERRVAREAELAAIKKAAIARMTLKLETAGFTYEMDSYGNALIRWGNHLG